MNKHCTTAKEAAWNQRMNADAAATTAREEAYRLSDVAARFHFSRDDSQCLFTASGFPVQLAMTLTDKITGKARTVIVKTQDGEWFWFVTDMGACPVPASDLIACVQIRIGARLTGQLTGKVEVN